jgi:hypothetical protein
VEAPASPINTLFMLISTTVLRNHSTIAPSALYRAARSAFAPSASPFGDAARAVYLVSSLAGIARGGVYLVSRRVKPAPAPASLLGTFRVPRSVSKTFQTINSQARNQPGERRSLPDSSMRWRWDRADDA